jgi:sigma-B regulation protein RsbU (phosphoserine phosphatase)
MNLARSPKILVCSDARAAAADIVQVLEANGNDVKWQSAAGAPTSFADLDVLVIAGNDTPGPLDACRRPPTPPDDSYVPTLFVAGTADPAARLSALEAGADVCLCRPFDPGELLAQIRALLRSKERHNRLTEKAAETYQINKRLQHAHQRVNEELELARRVQHSFLPHTLPELPRVRFAVQYRPCGRVGGDFYDIFRLDENHVGFYVADAMGHGVPAGLLTMFLKKGVRAKEIFDNQYQLVPPADVLHRLNDELLGQRIAESSFITMVYALYNDADQMLQFSRAGHPHPVYVPDDREPQIWELPGNLLGVFDTKFSAHECQLRPRDKALFYTDGTDKISFEGRPAGAESFLACVNHHRALPIAELVDRVADDLFHQTDPPDDFTLLGLQVL